MKFLVVVVILLLAGICNSEIPAVFIDKGACSGEGCTYSRIYSAESDFVLYERPSVGSEVVGIITAGDTFLSKTGEVHTIPTRFDVYEESGALKPGDEVFALTYGGEGYFRIFHNGVLTNADLGFSPWGGTAGKTCDKPKFCFGQLEKELEYYWWIFALSEKGAEGWVLHDKRMRWIEANQ